MNKQLRDTLNNASKRFGSALTNTAKSFASLLRMIVLSRYSVARQANYYPELKSCKSCTILANGPSLKKAFEGGEVHYESNDVFAVNMFVQSPEFWRIKPKFYCLVDGAYFSPNKERTKDLVKILSEAFVKVDWDMYLFISAGCVNSGVLKGLNNSHIKVIRWNTTAFEGFQGLCYFMFRHNLAMPRCQTVINMALVAAINMGYENIYLYGADHSWTRDLRVDDENEVCYGDRHVYATSVEVIKKEGTIGRLLHAFANMFDAHWVINGYAVSRGVNIWNCTRDSFVDAYPRKYDF